MNKPTNQPIIVSGSELKKPDKKQHNIPLMFFTLDLINVTLILGSCVLALNVVLSLLKSEPLSALAYLLYASFIWTITLGFNTYNSLTRTIFALRCQDINERKMKPLFAKLALWKKLPGFRGNPYFCTGSSLSIFRACLGDTDRAVKELRELVADHKKLTESGLINYKMRATMNSDVSAVMLSNLGHLLILNNEFPEAEQRLEESIAIYEGEKKKSMGEVYPRADLARILIDRLAFEEALQQLDLAIERMNDHELSTLAYLNIDVETIICKAYAAVCQFKLGNDSAGKELTDEVIALLPTGPTRWTFVGANHAISMLARMLIERGEITDAEQVVYLSSACLTCETHPDFFEFKAVSDDLLKKIESRK